MGLQTGSSFEILSNHVEARHIQRREYPCQYCGKAFKTKNHKAVHIHRVHREEHKLAKVYGGPPELC
jgi:5-methylcytosine-specific restriction endonuclease McrA